LIISFRVVGLTPSSFAACFWTPLVFLRAVRMTFFWKPWVLSLRSRDSSGETGQASGGASLVRRKGGRYSRVIILPDTPAEPFPVDGSIELTRKSFAAVAQTNPSAI
jgi:hypothetical protein